MQTVNLPLEKLKPAPWNSNVLDDKMLLRLRESIGHYGFLENLVVRPLADGDYEVIGGNGRFKVMADMGFDSVPCVIVNLDDGHARMLAQALNRIQGEDDLGLRAEMVREILETISEQDVLAILPETAESLKALASIGQEDMAAYLQRWQQAQTARLRHMQFQFTEDELSVVEQALKVALRQVKGKTDNPNLRGRALVAICEKYLKSKRLYAAYRGRTS